jgi:hypothetical protein
MIISISTGVMAQGVFNVSIPQPDYVSNDWDGDGEINSIDTDDDNDGILDINDSTPFGGTPGSAIVDSGTGGEIPSQGDNFGIKTVTVKNSVWSNDPHNASTVTGLLCGGITTCTRYDGNYRGLYSADKQIDIEFESEIKINGLKLAAFAWKTPNNISIQYENSSGQYVEFFDYTSPGLSATNPEWEYVLTEISFPEISVAKIRFIADPSIGEIWMGYLEPLFLE